MSSLTDVAIANFGAKAKEKLVNIAASGEPEDQLRAPFEQLLNDMAELAHIPRSAVTAVGESSLRDLMTRPDYAVTVHRTLVGFVELKSPGKAPTRASFEIRMTKRNGSACVPCPTSSTRTEILSASGKAENCKAASFIWSATSSLPATNSARRPACSRCSRTFCAGSRSRRAAPKNWPT